MTVSLFLLVHDFASIFTLEDSLHMVANQLDLARDQTCRTGYGRRASKLPGMKFLLLLSFSTSSLIAAFPIFLLAFLFLLLLLLYLDLIR